MIFAHAVSEDGNGQGGREADRWRGGRGGNVLKILIISHADCFMCLPTRVTADTDGGGGGGGHATRCSARSVSNKVRTRETCSLHVNSASHLVDD